MVEEKLGYQTLQIGLRLGVDRVKLSLTGLGPLLLHFVAPIHCPF